MARGSALFLYLDGEQVTKAWLGTALRNIRIDRGLSVAELAKSIGTHSSTVYAIEAGDKYPSQERFRDLCEALQVTEAQVLDKVSEVMGDLGMHWSWS